MSPARRALIIEYKIEFQLYYILVDTTYAVTGW